MKATCIIARAVALCVCWYIQMVRPKPVMLEPRIETTCPIQTRMKPTMPRGCFVLAVEGVSIYSPISKFYEEYHKGSG
jgi:hypothetical protein